MHITKFGHSCFLVEEGNARILFDPGFWSEDISHLTNLGALFISHEHQDHTDPTQIKNVLAANPLIKIFTNPGVGKVLTDNNIPWTKFVNGEKVMVQDVLVEAVGEQHAPLYPGFSAEKVHNTGFLIAEKLFYPGDSFAEPNRPVEILALPVCAPWLKMSEALDYAKKINPKICFPVHDGMLKHTGPFHKMPQILLGEAEITVIVPEIGKSFNI